MLTWLIGAVQRRRHMRREVATGPPFEPFWLLLQPTEIGGTLTAAPPSAGRSNIHYTNAIIIAWHFEKSIHVGVIEAGQEGKDEEEDVDEDEARVRMSQHRRFVVH